MISYKVCIPTSKITGKIVCKLLHIVETDEEQADYRMENDRYSFDYKFFNSEQSAREYIAKIV